MKIGIMQPYFMPYIGYFSLIKHTDKFILFDPVQFIRHGWIERNRILKQNDGWLYIQVPLHKFSRDTTIEQITINNTVDWKNKIKAQLITYKKQAPNYYKVIKLVDEIFEKEFDSITKLNQYSLQKICHYLGFEKEIEIFSEMNLKIDEPNMADEWALNICKALNVENPLYINPIGGMDFFNKDKYTKSGINLFFQKMNITSYNQNRSLFEPGLSILDVLMFNNVEQINKMLDDFVLI